MPNRVIALSSLCSCFVAGSLVAQDTSLAKAGDWQRPLAAVYNQLTAFGSQPDTVRSRLGTPRDSTLRFIQDPGVPEARDTLVTWTYKDLAFTFVLAELQVLVEARATVHYPPIAWFTQRLRTADSARSRLGKPSSTQMVGDTLVLRYDVQPGEEFTDVLTLRFLSGRLLDLSAHPYID